MKKETKERIKLALLNDAEMIRGHVEEGLSPEDVGEKSEKGLNEYTKACEKACKMIEKLADKYKI